MIPVSEDWAVVDRSLTALRAEVPADGVPVALDRCVAGRLRAAYPVAEHDIEVRILDESLSPGRLTAVLLAVVDAVEVGDPNCRRVVYGAPDGDLSRVAAAEQAGFRYVLAVDIPDASLSLLVAEPDWVTRIDFDSDAVTDSASSS